MHFIFKISYISKPRWPLPANSNSWIRPVEIYRDTKNQPTFAKKKYNQTYVHTYNKSLISGTSSIFSFLQNFIFIFDESKLHTFSLFCPRLLYGVLLTVNVKSFETKNNESCYFVSGIYEMHFRQLL